MRLALILGLTLVLMACSSSARISSVQPSPALTPEQVVSYQVSALHAHNEPTPNAGVWTAYQFASPANRKITGPYGRFLQIIKAPENRALLHSREWRIGDVRQTASQASVVVAVTDDRGEVRHWNFSLSKQVNGSCKDCWMTDGVGVE